MATITPNGNGVLAVVAVASLLAFLAVEQTTRDVKQKWYAEKLEAATLAARAQKCIRDYRLEKGVFVDDVNDPNETALIGQDLTPITTDRGDIEAKLASTNPNVAAIVVELLKEAGVREKDHVAVAVTGSFPAVNIAVFAALRTLGATPVVITSVGASNWGANDPAFTWLDMEKLLEAQGIFRIRSVAASIGGGGDVGRGLSPEGRAMIVQAIRRNGTTFINEEHLERSIERRMKIYDAASKGHPIRAYINVGGGIASLGTVVNGTIIPGGLSKELPVRNYPVRGVIIGMAKRGVPVIHLYNVRQLITEFGLPPNPVPLPSPGTGGIFSTEKYNVTVTWTALVVLGGLVLVAAIKDRRRHRLGSELVPTPLTDHDHEL